MLIQLRVRVVLYKNTQRSDGLEDEEWRRLHVLVLWIWLEKLWGEPHFPTGIPESQPHDVWIRAKPFSLLGNVLANLSPESCLSIPELMLFIPWRITRTAVMFNLRNSSFTHAQEPRTVTWLGPVWLASFTQVRWPWATGCHDRNKLRSILHPAAAAVYSCVKMN